MKFLFTFLTCGKQSPLGGSCAHAGTSWTVWERPRRVSGGNLFVLLEMCLGSTFNLHTGGQVTQALVWYWGGSWAHLGTSWTLWEWPWGVSEGKFSVLLEVCFGSHLTNIREVE